jgi:hypothetical protein
VAELIADKNGRLCGTTLAGGMYDYGTVFELSPVPEPATSVLLLMGTLALLSRRRVTVSKTHATVTRFGNGRFFGTLSQRERYIKGRFTLHL